jgi:SAM-dependent methyltransferase
MTKPSRDRSKLSAFHRVVLRELDGVLHDHAAVLEVGSTDFSFRDCVAASPQIWLTADLFPPADLVIDLDSPVLRLPFPDRHFDVVICTEVIEHLRFATALIDELSRVLSARGSLLVSVPNITSLTYRIAWLFGHIPSCAASADLGPPFNGTGYRSTEHARWIAGHVGDYNLTRLRSLLSSRGFNDIRFKGSGLHHRRQIAPPWLVPANLSSALLAIAARAG